MTDLQALAESEHDDPEIVPTILPVDARLSLSGPVDTLLRLFERAASVSPSKEIIPGTAHALLQTVGEQAGMLAYARVIATDGDMTLSTVADGINVAMAGSALVPAQKIVQILRLAPTGTARIEVLGTTATVRSGRAQWTVQVPVGDSLPPAADVSGVQTHSMPVQSFLSALVAVKKAASASTARASLMQVSVHGGSLTALDGGRLHRQRVDGLPVELDLSIPLRAADEVIRLLRATEATTFEFGGNSAHLVFHVDQDTLVVQRALVAFPDVENLILGPALTNAHTLVVRRSALIDAVKRVRIGADPDYQALTLTLAQGKPAADGPTWILVVSARDRNGATAQEALDVSWLGPSARRALTVNHHYLLDLLTTLTEDDVIFRVGDDTKTTRTPLFVDDNTDGFTGWVQQMRPGYLA